MTVARWNEWVEEHGGESSTSLAGLKVSKLSCYLDGCRYSVCRDAKELEEGMDQRQSLLESLQVGKLGRNREEQFREQLELWKELALGFLSEIYTLRRAIESINKRYFDGQETLFPPVGEGFDQLLDSLEKVVDIYNEDLAGDFERVERLLNEGGDGHQPYLLTLNLEELIENTQVAAKGQVAFMVDMAKADALELLGENRQALELVDRHA